MNYYLSHKYIFFFAKKVWIEIQKNIIFAMIFELFRNQIVLLF